MIEELTIENSQKAINFIKNIKSEDRVALITHIDLDGITCAKIMEELIKPNLIKFLQYEKINPQLAKELKQENINKIIFTDISVESQELLSELENFAEILIIDHHQFKKDINSNKTIFINVQGYSAAYICYSIFSEIKNFEKMDWLVALSCLSDWMYIKNKEWMKKTYEKYSEPFKIENPRQGRFWNFVLTISHALIYFKENSIKAYKEIGINFLDIGNLEKYAKIVEKDINKNVEEFKKRAEKINGCWFFEIKSKYDISSRFSSLISSERIHEPYLLFIKIDDFYRISARQQNKQRNMSEFLKELTKDFKDSTAGGHIAASGAIIKKEDFEEFKERLKTININDFKI